MECNFIRNQQPVIVGGLGNRRRWTICVAPLLCVTAVLLMLFATQGKEGPVSVDKEDAVEELTSGESDFGPQNELDMQVRGILKAVAGDAGDKPRASSVASFLDDLDGMVHSKSDGKGVAAVAWQERSELPVAGEKVLDVYRDAGGVTLVSAGYIDLKGNVWAALLQSSGTWVDVVVLSEDDDATSEVRIVRLTSEGDAG